MAAEVAAGKQRSGMALQPRRTFPFGRLCVWLLASASLLYSCHASLSSSRCYGDIKPCVCNVKKNGLDILCEYTDLPHISKAMSVLKLNNSVIYYLKLRYNHLPKMQGFMFMGLDIRHLAIHNSSLAVVEETALSSLGKGLTQLDLSQNAMVQVPSASIKSLKTLLILNLNHNHINSLHSGAFEGLDTLEILSLYENKINNIDVDAFKGLTKKLKRLNLGGNDLNAIPTAALAPLEALHKLEIQENRISTVKEGDFEGLPSLDYLSLGHNQLKNLPARVFSVLGKLNSLELDGNQITHIDPEAFVGLEENLQYLRLGDNKLHSIPSDALRRLHRLRHLELISNNISFVLDDAFIGFGDSITFLNLQKNNIKVLPAVAFENLNSLETLYLQNNKISHLGEDVMEYVTDTLRSIDITGNPLVCDCDLMWYREWLKKLKDKVDDLMLKKVTMCTVASEHREYDLRKLPLERMKCVSKSQEQSMSSGTKMVVVQPQNVKIFVSIMTILEYLLISLTNGL